MKIWSLYIIQLVPLERGLLNGVTQCLYWIVIISNNIYPFVHLFVQRCWKINVALHNSGISVMLSYFVPSFGYDIICFSVCKIIIGEVQLRSFIGNFLKTHLYNVSEPLLRSPTLIYCYICINMPVLHAPHFPLSRSVLFSKTVWAFEGWPSIHISIAITLCYYLSGTSVEKIKFLFMFRSESSHFMPTFLRLFKQRARLLAFRPSLSPFCILVEFGQLPDNISEVNNTLNVTLTWLHFTSGSKFD